MKQKVTDHPSLGHLFFDESIRIEQIIWIAACSYHPPESFEDFLSDEDPKDVKKIFGLKRQLSDDPETALSELARANKMGFLVEAATPIPVAFHQNSCTTHGFGWCRLGWFYTEALDAAFVQRLLDWKAEVHAETRKKLEKEKPKTEEVSDAPMGPFASFP